MGSLGLATNYALHNSKPCTVSNQSWGTKYITKLSYDVDFTISVPHGYKVYSVYCTLG